METSNSQIVLYTCTDSPPGRAVQMVLKYLDIPYIIQTVDFDSGEHFSPEFLEIYPQGEIPVINDKGFILGESVAIIQYLAEKYGKDEEFYPKDVARRAVIHHHLAFHLSTYQRRVYDYMILPMDYAYDRTEENRIKLCHALGILNEFLKRQNSTYVAGNYLTIADPPMIMATVALNAMDFDLKPFPYVLKWYENFQTSQPDLWETSKGGLEGLRHYNKNPRDMSKLKHPIHPTSRP